MARHYSRRDFLKHSVAASSAGIMLPGLLTQPTLAANTRGHKALVCVFLIGGMDNNDVLIPTENTAYRKFAAARPDLLAEYQSYGNSRAKGALKKLEQSNTNALQALKLGLPSELDPLKTLFKNGKCAIVGSVGPLIEPVTRQQINSGTARLPKQLFSHNDQQSTWLTLGTEGTPVGWGAQFLSAFQRTDPAFRAELAGFSTSGNNTMLLGGGRELPIVLSKSGPTKIDITDKYHLLGRDDEFDTVRERIKANLMSQAAQADNMLVNDFRSLRGAGIQQNSLLVDLYDKEKTFGSVNFGDSAIGKKLEVVARMISLQKNLNVSRQIYFVAMGGFDTHNNQAIELPARQAQLATAIKHFSDAMESEGLHNDVTLFTAADFGRTLTDNGGGTDHGWGSHHFVVGGGVEGGKYYGAFPDPDRLSPDYMDDRGSLIPRVSVEQYASTLGAWFGLSSEERHAAFPNLNNFDQENLGFMKA